MVSNGVDNVQYKWLYMRGRDMLSIENYSFEY